MATRLAQELPATRPAVAKHLAVLSRARLVDGRRDGQEMRYTVRTDRLDDVSHAMAQVAASWEDRVARIKRLAESPPGAATGE